MSIASQITALGNNIGAAYNMINQRGGTIPARKNAENMATAIATIPSGGPTKDYGTVTIGTLSNPSVGVSSYSYCTVVITDSTAAASYFINNQMGGIDGYSGAWGLNLSWSSGNTDWMWYDYNNNARPVSLSELASNGISITVNSGATYASVSLSMTYTIDSTSPTQQNITDKYEYLTLGYVSTNGYGGGMVNGPDSYATINGQAVFKPTIIGYSFGNDCIETSDYFLSFTSIPGPLTVPSNVTSVGNYFFAVSDYDGDITFQGPIRIGAGFLLNCASFNSNLTIPAGSSVGENFMAGCTSYNKSFPLSNVASIGNQAMSGCTSFNQPISFANGAVIGQSLLRNCTSFNSAVDLTGVARMYNGFLAYCTAFSQSFTIPSSIPTVYSNMFMYGCNNFVGVLTVNAPIDRSDNYCLSTNSNTALMYTTGITLKGTYRSSWISTLPNRTSSSPYRKLINGGA